MIDTLIFDIGMVLVDFKPKELLKSLNFDEATISAVHKAMFESSYWKEFDRSLIADEELLKHFISNAPDYKSAITTAFDHVGGTIKTYEYAVPWIKEWKSKGYRCLYLSNFPRKTYEASKEEMSFLSDMDGGIFSFEIQSIKPEEKIYKDLILKYNLNPESCIFLDDAPKNIVTARELGLHTILFKNKEQAIEELRALNVV